MSEWYNKRNHSRGVLFSPRSIPQDTLVCIRLEFVELVLWRDSVDIVSEVERLQRCTRRRHSGLFVVGDVVRRRTVGGESVERKTEVVKEMEQRHAEVGNIEHLHAQDTEIKTKLSGHKKKLQELKAKDKVCV